MCGLGKRQCVPLVGIRRTKVNLSFWTSPVSPCSRHRRLPPPPAPPRPPPSSPGASRKPSRRASPSRRPMWRSVSPGLQQQQDTGGHWRSHGVKKRWRTKEGCRCTEASKEPWRLFWSRRTNTEPLRLTAGVSFQAQDLPVASVGQNPDQGLSREAHRVLHAHTHTPHHQSMKVCRWWSVLVIGGGLFGSLRWLEEVKGE